MRYIVTRLIVLSSRKKLFVQYCSKFSNKVRLTQDLHRGMLRVIPTMVPTPQPQHIRHTRRNYMRENHGDLQVLDDANQRKPKSKAKPMSTVKAGISGNEV